MDHESGSKGSLQTLLQYPYLSHDYLTQLDVLHIDLWVIAAVKSVTLWQL